MVEAPSSINLASTFTPLPRLNLHILLLFKLITISLYQAAMLRRSWLLYVFIVMPRVFCIRCA
jgi:hypothetical protein